MRSTRRASTVNWIGGFNRSFFLPPGREARYVAAAALKAGDIMYSRILVALENSPADRTLLPHISQLARHFKSQLILLHVADGWAARNYNNLRLAESEEIRSDRAYLEDAAVKLRAEGIEVTTQLAMGSPPEEILKSAKEAHCDLIAMTGHGHRLIGDLLYGSTIDRVRHRTDIPILTVRATT